MYLTGLVHRDRLFTIAMRWFGDSPFIDDGRLVTEIFLLEPLITGPAVRRFAVDILTAFHGEHLTYEPVYIKDKLRERVVECIPAMTPRIQELVKKFRQRPEEFFPRTPVDAVIFRTRGGRLAGMTRIKRSRRIAEKAARRMADKLIGLIREEADHLAWERSQRLGVPPDRLLSSKDEMEQDFLDAERNVAWKFRDRTISIAPKDLKIDDVLGLKFIVEEDQLARMESVLRAHPSASVVEREEHRGHYNAVNIQLDLALPPIEESLRLVEGIDWTFAAHRGIAPLKLARAFRPYLETGARVIRVEVILTSYAELVESEFGRSLHERRILRLRDSAEYQGRIARNAAYIIEYLLALAYSPAIEVDTIPIKLWGHYLPETLALAVNKLNGLSDVGLMFHHYIRNWADDRCTLYESPDKNKAGAERLVRGLYPFT